jgi:hypothetical protein
MYDLKNTMKNLTDKYHQFYIANIILFFIRKRISIECIFSLLYILEQNYENM